MIEFRKQDYKNFVLYTICKDNVEIGSIEMVDNFIENIFLLQEYRGKHLLTKIVNFLVTIYGELECLPLEQHVEKFKHLGFVYNYSEGTDNYYIRKASN